MSPKYWKKRVLNDHLKSVDKTNFKAKTKIENSYLKHFENVNKSEQIQKAVSDQTEVFIENRFENLDESQNDLIIDENPEAETEVDYEQDLIICEEEEDQDILEVQGVDKSGFQGQEVVVNSDNAENGNESIIIEKEGQDQVENDNQTIKDAQAPHPYAVPEPAFKFQENEEVKNIDFEHQRFDDVFAEEFTPIPPMFEDQEAYIPEFSGHKNATDFCMWIKRVKKQHWNNIQKKNVPWKNWTTNDFRHWFTNALVYQTRLRDPKSTPLFIKSLKNTQHKRFLFGEMESSQNRRRCWKSLNFY